MAVGRTYELKAKFSADVDKSVNDAFRSMHTRLNNLEKKIQKVNGDNVNVQFEEKGADELEKRIARIEAALKGLDKQKAEPAVGVDKTSARQFDRTIARLTKELDEFRRHPAEAELSADPKRANRAISQVKAALNDISNRAYVASIKADARGIPEVAAELRRLKAEADRVNGQKVHINVSADTGVINTFSSGLTNLITKFTSVEAAMSSFSRRAYFFQQAAQVAGIALVGLAAAASGPLLGGLTILGATLGAVAGGFGLVALAAAPIVSHFQNASENATKLKSAQDQLKSSTEALKNAQQSLADAQAAVGEAARSGHEQVQQAIQAHGESVRAVAEAERSAHENVRSAIDAHKASLDGVRSAQLDLAEATQQSNQTQEEAEQATEDYELALASEQRRLQSMRYDIEGMAISQEQLTLEIKEAERELAKAENPRERREAELRLQELQLQRKENTLAMKDAQEELNRAEAEGTEELQNAKKARDDAIRSQRENERAVRQAQKTLQDARREAVKSERGIQQARAEGQRQVREAMRAEQQAQQAIGKARQDAARQMSEAMKQVARAQADVAEAAKQVKADQGAVNALLSSTAGYLQPLISAVNRFKETYKNSFAGANTETARLGTSIVNLGNRSLPMLGQAAERTARGLQGVFQRLQGEGIKFGALESFRRILNQIPGITARISSAFGRFGIGLLNVFAQAMPFVRQFSSWLNRIAFAFMKWSQSERGRRQIAKFFASAGPVAAELWRWIVKIAGAILSWSIQHPERFAAVVRMIGQALMFVVRATIWVMEQIFKIAQAEHPWRRLALTILGARAALFVVGHVVGWLVRFMVARVGGWLVSSLTRAWTTLTGALRLLWMGLMGRIPLMAGLAVRGVLLAFARFTIIGTIIQFVVNLIRNAWTEIVNNTFHTVVGLYNMWQNGLISLPQLFWNVARQIAATLHSVILGAVVDTVYQIMNAIKGLMNWISGSFNLGDKLMGGLDENKKKLDQSMQGVTDSIRGNMNRGAEAYNRSLGSMENNTDKSGNKMKTGMSSDMTAIKNAMIKNSQQGSKQGQNQLKSFERGGSQSMNDLFKNGSGSLKDFMNSGKGSLGELKGGGSQSMKDLMNNSNNDLGNMKMKGLENFGNLKTGGNANMDDLQVGASTKAQMMEGKVTSANITMKEKGLQAVQNLQESGNAAMGVLQQQWVDKAWKTSIQTQESFNAILKGMAAFIEHAGVSGVKKPTTFSIMGNEGGSINSTSGGNTRPGGGGATFHNVRKGGEFRFARGGSARSQGPEGGISNGTTRVYGEVPGTTEFYVTDNPRYRKRNMQILQEANAHMLNARGNTLNFARGGEMKFAAGGSLPPQLGWDNRNSDGTLGFVPDANVADVARAGAAMWRGIVINGAGNVHVSIGDPGPGAVGRAYSNGEVVLASHAKEIAAAHEFGHQLGLGHGGDSIMGGAGMVTANDFAALKQYFGVEPPAAPTGGGKSGAGSGPVNQGGGGQTVNQYQEGPGPQRSVVRQFGGGSGGGGDQRNPDDGAKRGTPNANQIIAQTWKRLRQQYGQYFATGGILETRGAYVNDKQLQLAAAAAEAGSDRRLAKGVIWNSGSGEGQYGATNNSLWDKATADRAKEIIERFPVAVNTYENHPPGYPELAQSSIDAWDISGRGNPIGYPEPHNEVYNFMKNMDTANWKWTLGEGDAGHSGSYRHVHTSWAPVGEEGSGNMPGNSGPGGGPDYAAMYDKDVPKMASGLNYGKIGPAASKRGDSIREKHKSMMMKKTGNGSGNTPEWSGGGSLDEWLKQGIVYANAGIEASAGNISTLHGRAMQESGGDPNAVNNWDSNAAAGTPSKGLLQVIKPTWEQWMNEYGKTTGAFDSNWNDPIMNTATSVRYQMGHYGALQGANGLGYAGGGIARKPHVGLVGEKGKNELMWPLGSKKATRAVTRAFEQSKGVSTQSDPGGASFGTLSGGTGGGSESTGTDMGETNSKLDELKDAIMQSALDQEQFKRLLLEAIWAGLESPTGAEKVDKSLGNKWEKDARTTGEI